MSNSQHMAVPKSFKVLYGDMDCQSRYTPRNFVANRYELCESTAKMLTGIAEHMLASLSISMEEVLARCHRSLKKGGSVVTECESDWVIRRLAELLDCRNINAH